MSLITNIIVTCKVSEEEGDTDVVPPVKALNDWYGVRHNTVLLERVDEHAGGYKAMEVCVFAGAANYLDKDAYIAAFCAQQWKSPEAATLMLKDQDDDTFASYNAMHGGRPEKEDA